MRSNVSRRGVGYNGRGGGGGAQKADASAKTLILCVLLMLKLEATSVCGLYLLYYTHTCALGHPLRHAHNIGVCGVTENRS
jgi:hypothetical protein